VAGYRGLWRAVAGCGGFKKPSNKQQAASNKPQAKSKKRGASICAPAARRSHPIPQSGTKPGLPGTPGFRSYPARRDHHDEPHAAESNRFPATPVYGLVGLDGFFLRSNKRRATSRKQQARRSGKRRNINRLGRIPMPVWFPSCKAGPPSRVA
jgi:hypothetical protein